MQSFQNIVSTIAIILLIVCLIVIGIMMHYQKQEAKYPPVVPGCPDSWVSSGDLKCKADKANLGKDECPKEMDFSKNNFVGDQGMCNKYRWAKRCDVEWDGVTNNETVCE